MTAAVQAVGEELADQPATEEPTQSLASRGPSVWAPAHCFHSTVQLKVCLDCPVLTAALN